jgi:Ca2+-binding EF-hand superfamily protein
MPDFNTVAVFSSLDPHSKGYLDFNIIKDFVCKYESEVMKEQILSIIRRLSDQPDGKISFREFSIGITPDPFCLD